MKKNNNWVWKKGFVIGNPRPDKYIVAYRAETDRIEQAIFAKEVRELEMRRLKDGKEK